MFPSGSFQVFLDVAQAFLANGRVLNIESGAHGGLRSIAFHPKYKNNGLVYVSAMENRPRNPWNHTYLSSPRNHVSADSVLVEFRSKAGKVDQLSYRPLFRVGMPVFDHPIKQIEFFGNNLYIAHGDGSVQSATAGGGQNNDALGKILRINPTMFRGQPYTIPKSNPFPNQSRRGMLPEVYAYGFRNPHTLCFSKYGKLFVADAGRDNREEINLVESGRNYGWSLREGTCRHKQIGGIDRGVGPLPWRDDFEYPVAEYRHDGPRGAGFIGVAVAGGCPVENGSLMGGRYWFTDFPVSGDLYFITMRQALRATTRGRSRYLKQAQIYKVKVRFRGKVYDNLGAVLRSEESFKNSKRVDVRMGRGSKGELYWSSKQNGRVYLFTSSMPRSR